MLAIIELIIAILLVLSWFVVVPFGQFALAVALLVVLIIQLVLRRSSFGDHDRGAHPDRRFIVLERQAGSSSRASTADLNTAGPRPLGRGPLSRLGADAIELGDLVAGECDVRRPP